MFKDQNILMIWIGNKTIVELNAHVETTSQ